MMMRFAPAVVFFVLVVAFLVLLTQGDDAPTASSQLRPVPVLALHDFDGKPLALPQGEWVAVNFFASWCVPCVLEHPQMMELKAKGVTVVGVSYRDTKDRIKEFLDNRGNPYALVANDPQGKAALAFGITGVPETYLISPTGFIIWHYAGPVLEPQMQDMRENTNVPR